MAPGEALAAGLRQGAIADVAAVSIVHVNRVLHALQGAGLIRLERGGWTCPSPASSPPYAEFDPAYLHLAGRTPPEAHAEAFVPAGVGPARIQV